jgi:hypothetical protein
MIFSIFISSEDSSPHTNIEKSEVTFGILSYLSLDEPKFLAIYYIYIFICTRLEGLNYNSVKEALHAQYMNKANNNAQYTLPEIYVDHSLLSIGILFPLSRPLTAWYDEEL